MTTGKVTGTGERILIYATAPLHRAPGGGLLVDSQAVGGLSQWARNWDEVIAMMPCTDAPPPDPSWIAWPGVPGVRLEPLPMAYRPGQFLGALPGTVRRIRALLPQADYRSFSIAGLVGDWGAVSALLAHRMGLPYAVWTDRVDSEAMRRAAVAPGPWRARLRARLLHRPTAALERAVIRRASLGLFHGRETYEAYAGLCGGPAEVVHDLSLGDARPATPDEVEAKARRALAGGPLRIVYAGRAHPIKAPLHWLEALAGAAAGGVDFAAAWLGDGPEMAAMRDRAAAPPLAGRVRLPGFTTDRAALMREIAAADLFVFCHLIPESPRCLIEALVAGTPILGYASAYPADLIAAHGGGLLTPLGDPRALAEAICALDADRPRLADLIRRAGRDGAPFTDAAVFRHRSEVIRRHLPARRGRVSV